MTEPIKETTILDDYDDDFLREFYSFAPSAPSGREAAPTIAQKKNHEGEASATEEISATETKLATLIDHEYSTTASFLNSSMFSAAIESLISTNMSSSSQALTCTTSFSQGTGLSHWVYRSKTKISTVRSSNLLTSTKPNKATVRGRTSRTSNDRSFCDEQLTSDSNMKLWNGIKMWNNEMMQFGKANSGKDPNSYKNQIQTGAQNVNSSDQIAARDTAITSSRTTENLKRIIPSNAVGLGPNKKFKNDSRIKISSCERAKVPENIKLSADEKWSLKFNELVAYKEKYGDCLVPAGYEENTSLSNWVSFHRGEYKKMQMNKKNSLTVARFEALEELGFVWSIRKSSGKVSWEERFQELVKYKGVHGDCLVPQTSSQLGKWVNHQRDAYRNFKFGAKSSNTISPEQVKQLDDIGFVWFLKRRSSWDNMLKKLIDFKEEYGHTMVPKCWKRDPKLGKWCNNQRTAYKHMCDKKVKGARSITLERVKALDSINFVWNQKVHKETVIEVCF